MIESNNDSNPKTKNKIEVNPNIKVIKTECNMVLKDFVDFKNPLLEELDRENMEDEVEWIRNDEVK